MSSSNGRRDRMPLADSHDDLAARLAVIQRVATALWALFAIALAIIGVIKLDGALSLFSCLLLVVAWQLHSRRLISLCLNYCIECSTFSRFVAVSISAVFLLGFVVLGKLFFADVAAYKRLIGEGSVLEWLQFLILLIGVNLCMRLRADCGLCGQRRLAWFYSLLALLLVFVAGEELAWGQGLLGIESPEWIKENNAQNELTIHNLYFLQLILDYAMLWIASILSLIVLWVMGRGRRLGYWQRFLLPPSEVLPLLLLSVILYAFIASSSIASVVLNRDQEVAELALYLSVLMTLLRSYLMMPSLIRCSCSPA